LRNSAELYRILQQGILYNSAEFSLILYSIRNIRKWKKCMEFRIDSSPLTPYSTSNLKQIQKAAVLNDDD
jgi:hypothetical protein